MMTIRRLLAAAAATLALSLIFIALGLGVADLASVSANVWMREWEGRGNIDQPSQWDLAYSRLRLARRLNPLSADYSAGLGQLMEWRSWQQSPESAEFLIARRQAGQFYAETIARRPGWGFAWAHYAENLLLSGDQGQAFLDALRKAIVLAPWEPGVQRKVAWMGMATWRDLPDYMHNLVEESIRRTVELDTNLNEVVRLAVQYDWLDHLVPMLQSDRQLAALEFVLRQRDQR